MEFFHAPLFCCCSRAGVSFGSSRAYKPYASVASLPEMVSVRLVSGFCFTEIAALLKRLAQDAPRRLQAAALLARGRPGV
jgi:hypothetical protein